MIFLNEALSTTTACNRASLVPRAIELGLLIRTRLTWALGFRGETIVVAGADTGFAGHITLKPHYRGWDGTNANHNFNWHDSIHDTVSATRAGTIRLSRAMISSMEVTPIGTAIGDDGAPTRLEWLLVRSGSAAVTWIRDGTPASKSSAWNFPGALPT
jgi:hypothetical protein